ncbi:MAG: cysteine protease LapG [Pseudomonas sp.]|uniref:cysteine protease LapG n=1 Tax=Pseudomonas sp. TaxID=306 RepID=UPI0033994187
MQSPHGSPGWARRWQRVAVAVLAGFGLGLALASWDFAQVLRIAEQRYGDLGPAKGRLQAWQDLLLETRTLAEPDQLAAVNRFINRQLRFVDDRTIWKQQDYWASPVEALIQGAGDCEDYSIAKYFTLRELGVASDKLRITYVKALNYNQAHMVLTYYPSLTAEPLVLDNLINDIRPASQRNDLLPVYSFNAEGVYLPGAGGGKRSGDSKQLSRWQDLLKKMRAEGFAIAEG